MSEGDGRSARCRRIKCQPHHPSSSVPTSRVHIAGIDRRLLPEYCSASGRHPNRRKSLQFYCRSTGRPVCHMPKGRTSAPLVERGLRLRYLVGPFTRPLISSPLQYKRFQLYALRWYTSELCTFLHLGRSSVVRLPRRSVSNAKFLSCGDSRHKLT